ncbi:MAG: PAS domain S-box protein [Chloroflexi bacterium]|nr:PAS domain S-box protein [Chloroflexota bacterium]
MVTYAPVLRIFRRYSKTASSTVILIGSGVIVGWLLDVAPLKSLLPGLAAMKFNTALCFVLSGLALGLFQGNESQSSRHIGGRTCAGVVAGIALLTLIEYGWNKNLGLDQLFARDNPSVTPHPGRMSLITAFNFALISMALLGFTQTSQRSYLIAQALTLIVLIIVILRLVGYIYNPQSLYKAGAFSTIAAHTAILFLLLGTAMLVHRAEYGLLVLLPSDSMGGVLVRRLLPAAFLAPLLVGWIEMMGENLGYYNAEFARTLSTLSTTVFFVLVIWWTGYQINRVHSTLQASEAHHHRLLESAPIAIVNIDSSGLIQFVNAKTSEMFGYSPQELIGQPVELLLPERFRQRHAHHRGAFFADPRTRPMGLTLDLAGRRQDGAEFPIEVGLSYSQTAGGLLGMSFINDVTERNQRDFELRESESRYRRLLETAPIGIVNIDEQGVIQLVNAKTSEMFGYSAGELIGQSVELLLPTALHTKHVHHRASFFADPRTRLMGMGLQLAGRRQDGSEFPIEVGLSYTHVGNQFRAMSFINDITQRKQAEAEIHKLNAELEQRVIERTARLEALNRELEAFGYSVSHDLRAPLRGIDGFSLALLEDYGDQLDAEAQGYLRRIRANAQRMAQLIDDLLKLSQLTRQPMRQEQVDLSALAHEVAMTLKSTDPQREAEFLIESNLTTFGDAHLLRIGLENLIGNAWKFSEKQPQSRIEFGCLEQSNGDKRTYFVRDNGAGFDMAYADKLFGAFQRLHSMNEYQGTGIGLATVQRIIQRHGGQIWAEGAVQQGATFYFTL